MPAISVFLFTARRLRCPVWQANNLIVTREPPGRGIANHNAIRRSQRQSHRHIYGSDGLVVKFDTSMQTCYTQAAGRHAYRTLHHAISCQQFPPLLGWQRHFHRAVHIIFVSEGRRSSSAALSPAVRRILNSCWRKPVLYRWLHKRSR